MDSGADVTRLLAELKGGSEQARSELIAALYPQLRRARYMRSERLDHTLQPTPPVHEAYLEETAEALQVSPKTVKRDWRRAKDWLYGEIEGGKE